MEITKQTLELEQIINLSNGIESIRGMSYPDSAMLDIAIVKDNITPVIKEYQNLLNEIKKELFEKHNVTDKENFSVKVANQISEELNTRTEQLLKKTYSVYAPTFEKEDFKKWSETYNKEDYSTRAFYVNSDFYIKMLKFIKNDRLESLEKKEKKQKE